jgi:hypothetical protein
MLSQLSYAPTLGKQNWVYMGKSGLFGEQESERIEADEGKGREKAGCR